MAGNLESMLLGGSDDSSSDSDNELEEVTAGTVTTAASAVAATVQPVAPPVPAPVPPPAPVPAPAAPTKQSDLSARLKSLYSPASKSSTPSSARPAATAASALPNAPNLAPTPVAARAPTAKVHAAVAPTQSQPKPQTHVPSLRQQQQPQTQGSMYRPLVPNASAMPKSVPRSSDPFEPTPLKNMIEREQAHKGPPTASSSMQRPAAAPISQPQRRGAMKPAVPAASTNRVASSGIQVPGLQPQQQQQPPQLHPSASNVSTSSTASTVRTGNVTPAQARQRQEQEAKRRKEKFLMFTRVLMKYLEQKDPNMHARAKAVIRECAEKNKNKEAGYESVTASMQTRLRATVGDAYWKRAESYLNHFLNQKKEKVEEAKRQQAKILAEKRDRDRAAAQQKIQQIEKEAAEAKRTKAQKAEEAKARKRTKAQEAKNAKKLAAQQQASDTLAKQQREIAARRAALGAATAAAKTAPQQQAAVTRIVDAKKGKKVAAGKSPTAAPTPAAATPSEQKQPEMPPREYSELMEMVDHAVTYDWTSAGTLLGKDHKVDVNLNEEQNKLLYGEKTTPPVPGLVAASMAAGTLPSAPLPPALRGWSKRNVLGARPAWARIRLREQQERQKLAAAGGTPVVAGLTLPGSAKPPVTPAPPGVVVPNSAAVTSPVLMAKTPPVAKTPPTGGGAKTPASAVQVVPPPRTEAWFNDEKAEEDKTLALLSEATDMYIKSLLEKAIEAARQRQNLDGIRLWHQQHNTKQKPPLSIRLGCDVTRQAAQAEGNAAKTIQRMEEALERQKKVPAKARALDDDETLFQATSMSDLALRPKLASAASQADLNAKRSFEVYGGKDSGAPPFGRVPKKAKVVARDLQFGMEHSFFPHQRTGIAASLFM